jgi:methyl-accepting chemotaxis protein
MLPLTLRFRTRLILVCSALVALTTALMIVPLIVNSGRQAEAIYRERLTAVAHGTATALHPDTVELLAASPAPTSIPYVVVRNVLREFAWRTPDSTRASAHDGLLLVVATHDRYRVVAHSDWPIARPASALPWIPPAGLGDSVGNLRAGTTSLWWFSDDERLVAVAPVFAGTVPIGFVVASAPRSVATAELRRSLRRLAWYPAVALLLAVLLASILARQLTGRIERLALQAEVLAAGDLRVSVTDTGNDEFGRLGAALRDLAEHLRAVLGGVSTSASAVATAVDELASGVQEMKASSEQVGSAARTIAESAARQTQGISSISTLATAAASHAHEVSGYASSAMATATSIANVARRITADSGVTLARMTDISKVTSEAAPAVAELTGKSRRIAAVARAVSVLADQAQLLSLNAAIEAARAGEHGLGFGVVAREVGKLADGTSAALNDIQALAMEIEQVSQRTGQRMTDVRNSVSHGEAVITESAQSLGEILDAVAASHDATKVIAEHAAAQQTRAANVSSHVRAIGDAAMENAGMAVQVAGAVEAQTAVASTVAHSTTRLGAVVTELREALVRFKL